MQKFALYVIKLVLFICTVLSTVKCSRKYDVYSESLKLYGEDLVLVLKRFRKSPEYLSILNTQIKKFKMFVDDTFEQVDYNYKETHLSDRVNITLNHIEGHDGPNSYRKTFHQSQVFFRADDESNTTTTTLSPIEVLDRHATSVSKYSATEKNSFKDAGFEVAGDAIHKMIESIGTEEQSDIKSTRMPSGKVTTTTEHVTVHEVTSEPTEPTEHTEHADHAEHSSARFRVNKKITTSSNFLRSNSTFDKFHSMIDQYIS